MPIENFQINEPGQAGVTPRILRITTSDSIATVTATGYLNNLVRTGGIALSETDLCAVITKETPGAALEANWYDVSKSGDDWSLVARGGGSEFIIDDLPEGTSVASSDFLPFSDNGTQKKVSHENYSVSVYEEINNQSAVTELDGTEELVLYKGGSIVKFGIDDFLLRYFGLPKSAETDAYYNHIANGRMEGGNNSFVSTADRIIFYPTYLPPDTYNRIGTTVNTTQAIDARFGIFRPDSTGFPGELILDAGTISLGSSGDREITISQFASGWVYLSLVTDGLTSGTLRGMTIFPAISGANIGCFTPSPSKLFTTSNDNFIASGSWTFDDAGVAAGGFSSDYSGSAFTAVQNSPCPLAFIRKV
jgi:hypothetical protein